MASPFKSKAQIERCKKMVADGQMTQAYFDECMKATPNHEKLPERMHPKKDKAAKSSSGGDEAA